MARLLQSGMAMASQLQPCSTLLRAEMLLALSWPERALELFGEVPSVQHGHCAYRSLELRLLKAGRRWHEGMACIRRVQCADPAKLRQAAARFLVGYAMAELDGGSGAMAAKLVSDARALWPEGNVDGLALGADHSPGTAGSAMEEPGPRPLFMGWQGGRQSLTRRIWYWRNLIPRSNPARVRYRFVPQRNQTVFGGLMVIPRWHVTIGAFARAAWDIWARMWNSARLIGLGALPAPAFGQRTNDQSTAPRPALETASATSWNRI